MPSKELLVNGTLTGTFLISSPGRNTELDECVIYLFEHASGLGAQGVVINRPSDLSVADLLEKMDYTVMGVTLNNRLLHGGMDDETGILMVHTSEWYSSNTRPVTDEISVTSDTFMIEKIMDGNEPNNWFMCAGRCSWDPGQVEREIKQGHWLVVPAQLDLLFSPYTEEKQWRKSLDYCTKYTVDSWL